jgi:tetratricopeptide (TPR) repeat protein
VWRWIARESPADREKRRWFSREQQANSAEAAGQWFTAAFHLGHLIQRDSNNPDFYRRRGHAYAEQGKWKESLADFSRACELQQDDAWHGYRCGLALLAGGDEEGYRKACTRILQQFGKTWDAPTAAAVASLAVLRPDAVRQQDVDRLVHLADRVALKGKSDSALYLAISGAALCRAGTHEDAVKRLERAVQKQG